MKIALIANPYSGGWKGKRLIPRVERMLKDHHIVYDLLKAIDEDKMPLPSFRDGVECQRVLHAVEKSIKERRWVTLREQES